MFIHWCKSSDLVLISIYSSICTWLCVEKFQTEQISFPIKLNEFSHTYTRIKELYKIKRGIYTDGVFMRHFEHNRIIILI